MNAARGERDYNIAGGHCLIVNNSVLVDNARAVAREVVFVYRIKSGISAVSPPMSAAPD